MNKLKKIQKALDEFDRNEDMESYQIIDTIKYILNEVEE